MILVERNRSAPDHLRCTGAEKRDGEERRDANKNDSWGQDFRSLLDAGLVNEVQVAVIPVMLGSGVPLIPEGRRCSLHLDESKIYPSGIVLLSYSVPSETATRS